MDQYDAIPDELRERERCVAILNEMAKQLRDRSHYDVVRRAVNNAQARVLEYAIEAIRGEHQ